jgi:hypothetical protein
MGCKTKKKLSDGGWLKDNKQGVLGGLSTAAGIGLMATGIGGPLGVGLIGKGVSMMGNEISQDQTIAQNEELLKQQRILAQQQQLSGLQNKYNPVQTFANGGEITQFNGNSHEQGGIPLGQNVEVENGESRGIGNTKDYVFSDKIKIDKNKTFSDEAKKIEKKYGNVKSDKFALESKNLELANLMEKQEGIKMDMFQKDMAKMATKYPEEMKNLIQQEAATQQQMMTQQQSNSQQQITPEQQQMMQQQQMAQQPQMRFGGRIKMEGGGDWKTVNGYSYPTEFMNNGVLDTNKINQWETWAYNNGKLPNYKADQLWGAEHNTAYGNSVADYNNYLTTQNDITTGNTTNTTNSDTFEKLTPLGMDSIKKSYDYSFPGAVKGSGNITDYSQFNNGLNTENNTTDTTETIGSSLSAGNPDWLGIGASMLPNLAQGVGSAILAKRLQYPRTKAEVYNPTLQDPTMAMQNINTQYSALKNVAKNNATGTGNYMANMIGITGTQAGDLATTANTYDSANATIKNTAKEFNTTAKNAANDLNATIGMQEKQDKVGLYQNALSGVAAGLNTGVENYFTDKRSKEELAAAGGENFSYGYVPSTSKFGGQQMVKVFQGNGYKYYTDPNGGGNKYLDEDGNPITKAEAEKLATKNTFTASSINKTSTLTDAQKTALKAKLTAEEITALGL